MKYVTFFFLILGSVLQGGISLAVAESPPARAALKEPAPAFTLKLFSGETVHLSDFRGKVLVLNFWHSG